MVRFLLDLEMLEKWPTNTLPGFVDGLLAALPGLHEHGCSLHRPGGFVERMHDGTWLGHVVEHVVLELQNLAGTPVTRGKTRSVKGQAGVYNVMYAYREERVGLAAGRMGLELVSTLLPEAHRSLVGLDILAEKMARSDADGNIPGMAALLRLSARSSLGPTTKSLVDEARRRGIPVERLDEYSLVRLGHGVHQKLLRASITGQTSHLGVEVAGNKALTKILLSAAAIPVPEGGVVRGPNEAVAMARRLGRRVVTKPLNGNHGRGVTLGLANEEEVRRGFALAAAHSDRVIVEQQFTGRDYRILVINGQVVAVAERVPAGVTGDGARSIRELVQQLNADPRRGKGHQKVMTEVAIDLELQALLAQQGLGFDDVPQLGVHVLLRETPNLSTGGEAIDRTEEIHPENRSMAERAARVIGLDIAGLDVIAPDISRAIAETGGGIVEINAAPGFRMHLQPSKGVGRNVAKPVIEMLFPPGTRSRIPIIAVTGTNGKTTTVRMISHILGHTGRNVGMTTTSGIYIDGRLVRTADASGPKSARMVLGDPMVDIAVLETARGGMLREGLAFDRADIGMVLNVTADHLGLKGIDTLEDLAAVKSIVAQQVRRGGTSILNADDPLTAAMAKRAGGRIAYFTLKSLAELSSELQSHMASGGLVAAVEPASDTGLLVLRYREMTLPLLSAREIPATLGGAASFNVQNALAAATAAFVQGVKPRDIAEALRSFDGSFEQNPGRLNVTRAPGFTTILDYAHNPAALLAIGELIVNLRPHHKRIIGVVSIPGDRRDGDIREMGQIAAGIFDYLIFRERPDGRGRASGGVVSLLSDGAIAAGMNPRNIVRIMDEHEAIDMALRSARHDDLVAIMPTDVLGAWAKVQGFDGATQPRPGLQHQEDKPVWINDEEDAVVA